MQNVVSIPLWNLALGFVPAFVALLFCLKWSGNAPRAGYSLLRMLVQLLIIGYFLSYIFDTDNPALVLIILLVMIAASSWIAIGSLREGGARYISYALISISVAGLSTLALVTQGVLQLDPWYSARYTVPLAGMIFASAMNSISLAGERLQAELAHELGFEQARAVAFNAALIPNINAMFAVGLVSLPGMMTGQILSGVSPLIAVRYQIVVMCMIFGASAMAAGFFLALIGRNRER